MNTNSLLEMLCIGWLRMGNQNICNWLKSQMVKYLCPRYQLPSHNCFSCTALPKLYFETYSTLASHEATVAVFQQQLTSAKDPF